ncbi:MULTISPECIES: P-II family nitrogen regulator [Enterococcus]|uniref:P-II family nitrogen regulator n=1 Tax=Enterococcus TaxID=1350 RepID=UPI00065E977C|nr:MULTISPECIES: P-II family nitrogen regulator [Enterococcus]KAF1300114.1 transcriptional regulator [Enterococcus sp. JM9B]
MNRPVALNLEMIVTIVDKGVGSEVIGYSKEAGANGGTVIHAKGSGAHDSARFFGIEIEPEKDIVLTLVPDTLTNEVMQAIGSGIQISKPGNGICFSIDIDKVIGITEINSYRKVVDMERLLDEGKQ